MPGRDKLMLWCAQGFGIGRIPWAPGTFGSVLGLLWFALLLSSGNVWVLVLGSFAVVGLSVWLCEAAERMLGRKDPGSVVLDEVASVPFCFLVWLVVFATRTGSLADLRDVFSADTWMLVAGVFAAFRLFDILKPWPVRQSQVLPGGWGITIDDLLAAVYVNLLFLAINTVKPLL
jgi:phosphatidylglycerophosphatase A